MLINEYQESLMMRILAMTIDSRGRTETFLYDGDDEDAEVEKEKVEISLKTKRECSP